MIVSVGVPVGVSFAWVTVNKASGRIGGLIAAVG